MRQVFQWASCVFLACVVVPDAAAQKVDLDALEAQLQRLKQEEVDAAARREARRLALEQEEADAAARREAIRLASAPFVQISDGILDNQQKVVWTSSDNGRDIGWDDARSHCSNIGSGWSLPTTQQLTSLYQHGSDGTHCGSVTCRVSPLLRLTGTWFWTSESAGYLKATAFSLANGFGFSFSSSNPFDRRALCVRQRS